MSMLFMVKPTFHFYGKWSSSEKALVEDKYETFRSVWVDLFNEHIASFNDAFDRLHPNHGRLEEGSQIEKEYYEFLCNKMKPYNSGMNNLLMLMLFPFTVSTSNRCDFELINDHGGTVYCTYEFV